MIQVGRWLIFLRGFDQSSQVHRLDISAGDRIILEPEKNWRHRDAIAAKTLDGRHVGRVARELARPCKRLLATLRSQHIRYNTRFIRFSRTEEPSRFTNGTFTGTRVELEIIFYAEDPANALRHLSSTSTRLQIDFEPVVNEST